MIAFLDVNIRPVGKARPRFTRNGHAYTPKTTAEFEKAVRNAYKSEKQPCFSGAVCVMLTFEFKPSERWRKPLIKDALEGRLPHTQKPDTDNIVKACLDSLNGVAFHDDSQVVSIVARKRWAEQDKVRIMIFEDGAYEFCRVV